MTQSKPNETLSGERCPICNEGQIELLRTDFDLASPDEPTIVIPGIWVDRCNHCNEQFFPSETSRYIEDSLRRDRA